MITRNNKELNVRYYDCIVDFVQSVFRDDVDYDDEIIDIVCKFDVAIEILNELVRCGFDLYSINIESADIYGYEDEYVISIGFDGIYCEPFKRETGYINLFGGTAYVHKDCDEKCFDTISSDVIQFWISDDLSDEVEEEKNMNEFEGEDVDCENCKLKNTCTDYKSSQKDISDVMKVADTYNHCDSCCNNDKEKDKLVVQKDSNGELHGFTYSFTSDDKYYNKSFYSSVPISETEFLKIYRSLI